MEEKTARTYGKAALKAIHTWYHVIKEIYENTSSKSCWSTDKLNNPELFKGCIAPSRDGINDHPLDKNYQNLLSYPLDSDLSNGGWYLTVEQLGLTNNIVH